MSAIAFLVSSIAPRPLAKFVLDHWRMVRRDANEIKIPFFVLAFCDSVSGSGTGDSPVCAEFGLVTARAEACL